MIDSLTLLTFVPAAIALNLTPGADMMFCLGQGLRSGPRASAAASAGIAAGTMVHVFLAGLGLGALVSAMPWLFDAIRWIGVGYLLFLAWRALQGSSVPSNAAQLSTRRAFRDGFLVNLTNPKVILFVLAFIPQFIDPAAGLIFTQFLIFGLVIALGGFVINGSVGVFAGGAGRYLAESPRTSRIIGWISGGIFAALALRLAIVERA